MNDSKIDKREQIEPREMFQKMFQLSKDLEIPVNVYKDAVNDLFSYLQKMEQGDLEGGYTFKGIQFGMVVNEDGEYLERPSDREGRPLPLISERWLERVDSLAREGKRFWFYEPSVAKRLPNEHQRRRHGSAPRFSPSSLRSLTGT